MRGEKGSGRLKLGSRMLLKSYVVTHNAPRTTAVIARPFLDCPEQGELAAMLRNEWSHPTGRNSLNAEHCYKLPCLSPLMQKLHCLESNLASKFDERLNGVDETFNPGGLQH